MASAGKVGLLPWAPSKPGNEKHQSQQGKELADTVNKSSARIPTDILSATSLGLAQNQRRRKSLLSLCVSCLGCHLHDIIDEIHLIAPILSPSVKIQLIAIARRRRLLCDEVLVPLADEAWELLDVSGSDVTDAGICEVAKVCPLLKAADISRCSSLTAQSIRALVHHCPGLETLRCGGTHLSNTAARLALPYLLPGLNVSNEVEDWEDLETEAVGRGAQSLHWIVWPSIDEKSKGTVEAQCPRMVVNPKRTKSYKQPSVPREALSNVALDEPFVEDIDPSTWAVRFSHVSVDSKSTGAAADIPIAERFRLAFVARDERLAPKRAKNWRQNQRRAEKVWLSSNVEAKARYLAAGLSKASNI